MKNVKMTTNGTLKSLTQEQAQSIVGGVDCPDLRSSTVSMKINEVALKINIGAMKINAAALKI
ncbi:hypothetical protein GCM10027347_41770 [Larkinella harenae]